MSDYSKNMKRLNELRIVCAEAYQLAGAYDAPIAALDNLSAAANDKPIPHKTFLPITPPENPLAERVKSLEDSIKHIRDTTFNQSLQLLCDEALAAKETACEP